MVVSFFVIRVEDICTFSIQCPTLWPFHFFYYGMKQSPCVFYKDEITGAQAYSNSCYRTLTPVSQSGEKVHLAMESFPLTALFEIFHWTSLNLQTEL